MKPVVFFRDDDVGQHDVNIVRTIELFQKLEIPLSLEVVPNNIQKEFVSYFNSLAHKEIFDIGQHGCAHVPYFKNNRNKGEFGSNRTYNEKKRDILTGWKKIQQNFPNSCEKIFIPPWGLMDSETYLILKEFNYTGFSLTGHGRIYSFIKKIMSFLHKSKVCKRYGMIDLSVSMDNMANFEKKTPKTTEELINDFKKVSGTTKYVGIMLHDKIMDDNAFTILENFILYLKNSKIDILNMKQIIKASNL